MSLIGFAALPPTWAVIGIIISLVIGRKVWTKGAALAASFIDTYKSAAEKYKEAEAAVFSGVFREVVSLLAPYAA
jgi:Sec-independent protein translocase protein TatA